MTDTLRLFDNRDLVQVTLIGASGKVDLRLSGDKSGRKVARMGSTGTSRRTRRLHSKSITLPSGTAKIDSSSRLAPLVKLPQSSSSRVLSLLFIDSVEKDRRYDSDGHTQKGPYTVMFEEDYKRLAAHPDYSTLIHEVDLSAEASDVHENSTPLADLDHSKLAVLNSLSSPIPHRVY